MKKKNPISEDQLNSLLKDFYLNENSNNINEKEAKAVFGQDYNVKIDIKKEQQLLKRLKAKKNGFWNFKSISFFVGLLVSVVLIALFFLMPENEKISDINSEINPNKKSIQNNQRDKEKKDAKIDVQLSNTHEAQLQSFVQKIENEIIPIETKQAEKNHKTSTNTIPLENNNLPKLTADEKAHYFNIKMKMLAKLIDSDKELYSFIPAGKISYKDESTFLDAFTIRNMGVTNLEYKAFLIDLISQKRIEDYKTAKIHSENWNGHNCPTLAKEYFENKEYDDFPVVNLSVQAALLFCNWLEEESLNYCKSKNLKEKSLTIRLPYVHEWIYLAKEGYARFSYELGYNTVYDESEKLVDKSFAKRADIVTRKAIKVDSLYTEVTTNTYQWEEKKLLNFFSKAFSYNMIHNDVLDEDRMKVYGKIGRVSEITPQQNSEEIWFVGKTWKDKKEYEKLKTEFTNNTSSPFVGFRFVVIKPNDPTYKNPFW